MSPLSERAGGAPDGGAFPPLVPGELTATWHALSCLGDGVITTDLHGRVSALNTVAEMMTGWSAFDAVDMPLEAVFRIIDERSGLALESPVSGALRAGGLVVLSGHTALATRHGERISIENSAAPFHDPDGHVCGAVMIFRDVSGRRRAEEALRAAGRRTDELLATLAHELRNPLAPIRQAALIAGSARSTEEQKRWSHEVIERQVSNMALLLDDLLDLSRITRGKLVLRVQPARLSALVDAAVETTRPLIEARRHRLTLQLPPEPVCLGADPLRMAQVLANLLSNAAKYTDPEGEIRLTAGIEAEEIVIRVADSGIGIPPEALPRLFEMFARGSGRRGVAEDGGLGIGLALTKGLVELHGGRLEARSEGLGKGSEFTVRLPRGAVAALAAPPAPVAQAAGLRRVLIADDNRDCALSLAALLRLEGHEVTVAHDGPQALESFAAACPDVALLDIGMPGLSGYEVARRIRKAPGGAGVRLIAITGYGQEGDRERAFESGFDQHLTKPVEWHRVAALVQAAPPPAAP
jgi:PAS domain S-box-containing protein